MLLNLVTLLLQILLVGVCLFMVLIILMQRSKNDGLGAAFGSGMTDSVFGSDTSNVLSKLTVYCAIAFFVIVLALTSIHSHRAEKSAIAAKLEEATATAEPTPAEAVPQAADATGSDKPVQVPAPTPTPAPAAAPAPKTAEKAKTEAPKAKEPAPAAAPGLPAPVKP
jgi:preprotein translocase subunit SecG